MADVYEISIAMDLRDDLSDGELGELRRHLGLDPSPGTVETGSLLGHHGEAWKVGGALTSVLAPRRAGGWALTVRQEIHPDQYDEVGDLIAWLAARATDRHTRFDGSVHVGWIRFYDCEQPDSLVVRDGRTVWPS
ncbi:hypothetical protein AB0J57_13390 [Streptomyces sp. NPDC049837]|uniref:hypothetical protein n=1 Tax=Streptomyces sp. NPDC049837 TaxID=3155277 RepID=UPI00342DFEC6